MISRIRNANGPVWVRVAKLTGTVAKGTVLFAAYHPGIEDIKYFHGAFDFTYNTTQPEAFFYKINKELVPQPYIGGVRITNINDVAFFLDLMIVWSEWAEPENDMMINVQLTHEENLILIPAATVNDNWNRQPALNEGMSLQGGVLQFDAAAAKRPLNKVKIVINDGKIIFKQLNLLDWGLIYPFTNATVPLISKGEVLRTLAFEETTPLIITSIEGNTSWINFIDRTTFHELHKHEGGYLNARSPLPNTHI